MTKRNGGWNLAEIIKRLNPVIRGFVNYFSIANCKSQFSHLASWIRRRLRAVQLRLWKKPSKLHRRLKQIGYKPPFKFIKMNSWRNAASNLSSYAMQNKWFKEELGLYWIEEVETGWLSPSIFVRNWGWYKITWAVYEVRTYGSVRGMRLAPHPTRCVWIIRE